MLKLGKTKRAVAIGAAALVVAGGTTLGLGGIANASVGNPPASTTDWFSLYLMNDSGGRTYQVCSEQSAANTIDVGVYDNTGGFPPRLEEVNTGVQFTSDTYINFSPRECVELTILTGKLGDKYTGYIYTPHEYDTGEVSYN